MMAKRLFHTGMSNNDFLKQLLLVRIEMENMALG